MNLWRFRRGRWRCEEGGGRIDIAAESRVAEAGSEDVLAALKVNVLDVLVGGRFSYLGRAAIIFPHVVAVALIIVVVVVVVVIVPTVVVAVVVIVVLSRSILLILAFWSGTYRRRGICARVTFISLFRSAVRSEMTNFPAIKTNQRFKTSNSPPSTYFAKLMSMA